MDPIFTHSWLFEGISQRVKQEIYTQGELLETTPNETLIQKGLANDHLFLVLDGKLKAQLTGSQQDNLGITVARREAGDMLGEYSFFDNLPPAVTVISETRARIFRINHAALRLALADDPEARAQIYRNMLVYLVTRLRAQDRELEIFTV